MLPATFLRIAIRPTLQWLGPPFDSATRELLLLSIALQESSLKDRVQRDAAGRPLPHLARGYYQFERGPAMGIRDDVDRRPRGVSDVLRHPRAEWAHERIRELGYPVEREAIHEAVADNDILATLMSVALLWTHPRPLPVPGEVTEAWAYYEGLWRPGKPRPDDWPRNYANALKALSS